MKFFSIKRVLGLAAIYGAVQYARKHGGPKSAFNELLDKAKAFTTAPKADASSSAGASAYNSPNVSQRDVASDSAGFGGNGRGGY